MQGKSANDEEMHGYTLRKRGKLTGETGARRRAGEAAIKEKKAKEPKKQPSSDEPENPSPK